MPDGLLNGMYIITEEGEVRPARTLEEVVKMWKPDARTVWKTFANKTEISTVFLAIDHGWYKDTAPILYETMVFAEEGSPWEDWGDTCRRYATREEAVHGHAMLLKEMGIEDYPPDFKHEPVEQQLSRLQILMEE